jgi:hypothetical protein
LGELYRYVFIIFDMKASFFFRNKKLKLMKPKPVDHKSETLGYYCNSYKDSSSNKLIDSLLSSNMQQLYPRRSQFLDKSIPLAFNNCTEKRGGGTKYAERQNMLTWELAEIWRYSGFSPSGNAFGGRYLPL